MSSICGDETIKAGEVVYGADTDTDTESERPTTS